MTRKLLLLLGLLAITPAAAQNYTATQGSGTTFGAKLVSTVLYPQLVFCDPATPAQCVGVNSSGQMTVLLGGTLPAFASTPTVNLGTLNGAATAALQTTINTTLGSPFQAGASIGNTAFGISGTLPAYASIPAFKIDQTTPGTTNAISGTVIANLGTIGGAGTAANQATIITALGSPYQAGGALPLPTGASTATNQTAGTQKTQIVDGSGNVIASTSNALNVAITSGGGSGGTSSNFSATFPTAGTAAGMSQGGNMVALTGTSNNLNVQCANCSGSGVSTADQAAFTAGTSLFAGTGGFFQTTATSNPLTNGQQGMFQVTANRALFSNLRNASGTEIGTSATPVQVSVANTGANATAMLVTGTAGTFPITGSISNTTFAATQATAASLNATVVGTGTFATQAAQSGTWNIGTVTTLPALVAGSAIIGKVGIDQTTPGTTNAVSIAQVGASTLALGSTTASASIPVVLASNQTAADPCMYQKKTNLPISQNGTSSVQLIALSGSTTIYICSLSLVAAGATTVALTTGTGTACVTGNAAVIGTTTASIANSMSMAANGGMTLGNGGGTIANGAASSELCMVLGTSAFVSGNLTYVQQ